MAMLDRLDPHNSDEYWDFLQENYTHFYFCNRCGRTFQTKEPAETCKFCETKIINDLDIKDPTKRKYRYFCVKCERTFVTDEKVEECYYCGKKMLHSYPWDKAGRRESVMMKFFDVFKSLKKKTLPDISEPKLKEIGVTGKIVKNDHQNSYSYKPQTENFMQKHKLKEGIKTENHIHEKLQTRNENPIAKKRPFFSFSRNKEEMPSR